MDPPERDDADSTAPFENRHDQLRAATPPRRASMAAWESAARPEIARSRSLRSASRRKCHDATQETVRQAPNAIRLGVDSRRLHEVTSPVPASADPTTVAPATAIRPV